MLWKLIGNKRNHCNLPSRSQVNSPHDDNGDDDVGDNVDDDSDDDEHNDDDEAEGWRKEGSPGGFRDGPSFKLSLILCHSSIALCTMSALD